MTAPAQNISEETLAAIAKAQTTGLYESTGLYSFDLSGLINLIPVVTPFRDLVARTTSPDGNPYAVWRAFLNATNSQPDPSMGFDFAAPEMVFSEQDFQSRYVPTGMAFNVTQDAFDLAKGYADPYAAATFQTLNQVLIGDDRKQMGAQSFALKAATAPTLTQNITGGTINANTTVYVGVAGRTGSGYYYGSGNSQGASQSGESGSGGNANSVTAVTAAIRGAVCYDWFQSANGSTWWYYGTTTVNTITMTSVITSNNAVSSGSSVPDLTTLWKGVAGVPTYNGSADNGSANPNDYDGFLASLCGDYNGTGHWVQPNTGTANPSVWTSLNGAGLTLSGGSINEIEEYLFLTLWQQVKCSPDGDHDERRAGAGSGEPGPGLAVCDHVPADRRLGPCEHDRWWPGRRDRQRACWRGDRPDRGPRLAAARHDRGQERPGPVPAGQHLLGAGAAMPPRHRRVRLRASARVRASRAAALARRGR